MRCSRCGRGIDTNSYGCAWIGAENDYVCESCLDRYHYWQCDDCGVWFPAMASNHDGLCANCAGCHDDDDDGCGCEDCSRRVIRNYGYKPEPEFFGTGPLFLGAEIEIATPYRDTDRCARVAQRRLGGMGYLKADASIGDGFEIVTHPMSYAFALNHFPWDLLPELESMGCLPTDACGMHVHVSRAGFRSPCHQYRWQKFVYRNQLPVQQIARRRSAQWAAFSAAARLDVRRTLKGGGWDSDRYVAINPCNSSTLELRIFASTLDATEGQAALGLAHASIAYTRDLTANKIIKGHQWEWPAFDAWVHAQNDLYAPLAHEMDLLCVS